VVLARQLALPPDPCALARRFQEAGARHLAVLHASERLQGRPGAALVAPGGDPLDRWSFVAAEPDLRSERLDPLADDPDVAADLVPAGLRHFPRWIGALPYEHRRDLERAAWRPAETRPGPLLARPVWLRYPAVVGVDHLEGRVLVAGRTRAAVDALIDMLIQPPRAPALPPPRVRLEVVDDEPPGRHVERVRIAKELIARGDLYQVNMARRLRLALRAGDPLALHERLARAAPSPFGALLTLDDGLCVVSTSPELFLLAEPAGATGENVVGPTGYGLIVTAPIKGTRPRGRDAPADAALARELEADPKERAELTMIIDVERNDLGRVAVPGAVRLLGPPRVVTHRTVHHRVAWLSARARPDVSREAVLCAMLPSGSVTGAPKVRAMEVIASLEPRRRGLYTGAFGCVAHGGRLTLAMAIRTAVLVGSEGEYFTGGGIVADSDPERELEETRWKAAQLQRAAEEG
jgi:anthranilate/para-aminobenzoate synthase component I